jgi:transcriptional regulator with XRE-family HTH domain
MARRPSEEAPANLAKETATFQRTLNRFRKRVRELRQMHGLSYADLERRSNVSWRQLVAIEKGEPQNPTLVTVTRLADAFGVPPHELLMPATSGVRAKKTAAKVEAPAEVVELPKPAPARKKRG